MDKNKPIARLGQTKNIIMARGPENTNGKGNGNGPEGRRTGEIIGPAPFRVRRMGSDEFLPVTREVDVRLFTTVMDTLNPLLQRSGIRSAMLLGEAALIGHQASFADPSERPTLSGITVVFEVDKNRRRLGALSDELERFDDHPLTNKKIIVHEADQEMPWGHQYVHYGSTLVADEIPPIHIMDQWSISMPLDGNRYNLSVAIPTTGEDDIFADVIQLEVQDMRPEKTQENILTLNLAPGHLIRLMSIIEQDRSMLEILARMGFFEGIPTLLPTGEEYRRIQHNSREAGMDGALNLDLLREKLQIRLDRQRGDASVEDRGELSLEDAELPLKGTEIDHENMHALRINSPIFDAPFPSRDSGVIPDSLLSAEEANMRNAQLWLKTAERYVGGRAAFWRDFLTLSVQDYVKEQYMSIPTDPDNILNHIFYNLKFGYHNDGHTGNVVAQAGEIGRAMHVAAPEFVTEKDINTIHGAAALHDIIQKGDIVFESINFNGEEIPRIKRKARSGKNDGDNEVESAKLAKEFMRFVNRLYGYADNNHNAIYDPDMGYAAILATAPLKFPDGRIIQTEFEDNRENPAVQVMLLSDIGAANGMAVGREGLDELVRDSWGMVMEEEVEVHAAFMDYRVTRDDQGNISGERATNPPFTQEEKEKMAKIIKAQMLGQMNFFMDIRDASSGESKIQKQISQMYPSVQEAVREVFAPDTPESNATLEDIKRYLENLQSYSYDQLMEEMNRVIIELFYQNRFIGTHALGEDFPLYRFPLPYDEE